MLRARLTVSTPCLARLSMSHYRTALQCSGTLTRPLLLASVGAGPAAMTRPFSFAALRFQSAGPARPPPPPPPGTQPENVLKSAKPVRPRRRSYFRIGLVVGLITGLVWGALDHGLVRLEDPDTVQPPTKCEPFPRSITLDGVQFDNIGVGVRTVSFLNFHVYAVGIYVARDDIEKAREVLRAHDDLRTKLVHVSDSVAVIDALLAAGVRFTVRITPTRNTDFGHLRDGFVRSIMNNPMFKEIGNDGQFGAGLNELKQVFSRKLKAPKGDSIYMTAQADGSLVAQYAKEKSGGEHETLGQVTVPSVARVFYLQYLSGKNPNSPTARDSAVEGLLSLL